MECSSTNEVVCALRDIAETLNRDPSPWDGFFSGVGPVILGALLALLASWMVTNFQIRRQARVEYERRIIDALISFMNALGDRLAQLERVDGSSATVAASTPLGQARELESRADSFWMIARERDIDVAKSLKLALSRIGEISNIEEQARDFRVTGQILRAWRNEGQTTDIAIQRLNGLAPKQST